MATGLRESTSEGPQRPGRHAVVGYEEFVDRQLRRVSSYVRLSDLATGLLSTCTFIVSALLLTALIDHWLFDLGRWGRFAAFVVIAGGLVAGVIRVLLSLLLRRMNPAYAAKVVERDEPSLKNSLLNYVYLREDRDRLREVVYTAVEQQAAKNLSEVDVEHTVDHTPAIRFGMALAAAVVLFGLYALFSPKDPFQTVARVVAPWSERPRPSRVQITDVVPGSVEVYAGRHLDVSARVHNLGEDDQVVLIFSSRDGQIVNRRVKMSPVKTARAGGEPSHQVTIPDGLEGFYQDIEYRIEAGDAQVGPYRVTVKPTPSIVVDRVEYEYPAYMNKAKEVREGDGNIHAPEGTRVAVFATSNQPIEFAYLEFDPDRPPEGKSAPDKSASGAPSPAVPKRDTIAMQHEGNKAHVRFTLLMNEEARTGWHHSYRLRFTNARNESNGQPIVYSLDVIPDLAPLVDVLAPERRQVSVPENGTLPIEVRGYDPDYGLTELLLHFVHAGNPLAEVALLDAKTSGAEEQTQQPAAVSHAVTETYPFRPQEFGLHSGDLVVFWAIARDNRLDPLSQAASPRESRTMAYEIQIVEPRPGEAADQAGAQPENNAQQNDPPENGQGNQQQPAASQEGGPSDDNQAASPRNGNASRQNSGDTTDPSDATAQNSDQTGSDRQQQSDSDANPMSGEESAARGEQGGPSSGQSGGSQSNAEDGSAGSATDAQGQGNAASQDAASPNNTSQSNPSQNNASQNNASQDSPSQGNGSTSNAATDDAPTDNARNDNASAANQSDGVGQSPEGGQSSSEPPGAGQENTGETGNTPSGNNASDNHAPDSENAGSESAGSESAAGSDSATGSDGAAADDAQGASGQRGPVSRANRSGDPNAQKQDPLTTDGSRDGDAIERILDRIKERTGQSPEDAAGDDDQSVSPDEKGQESGTSGEAGRQENNSGASRSPSERDPAGRDRSATEGGQPSAAERQDAATDRAGSQQPGSDTAQQPSSDGAQQPGSDTAQQPGSDTAQQPGSDAAQQSGSDAAQQSGQESTEGQQRPGASDQTGESADRSASADGATGPDQSASSQDPASSGQAARENGGAQQPAGDRSPQPGDRSEPPRDETTRDQPPQRTNPAQQSGEGQQGQPNGRSGNNPQPTTGQGQSTAQGGAGDAADAHGAADGEGDDAVPPADEVNMEYAQRATDLVLDYLRHDENRSDRELLERLGWSSEDVQEFVKRWEQLKQDAARDDAIGQASRRELDSALRSLGLSPSVDHARRAGTRSDRIEGVQDAGRATPPPSKYREQWREFRRSISGVDRPE